MRRTLFALVLLALAAYSVHWWLNRNGEETLHYRLVEIQQGDLEATVSATGSLEAVTTVQVGTQVSGIIDEINVDFNDTVEAGQIIARIDTSLLQNAVTGSRAGLERSQAELRQAERESQRIKALHAESLVSDAEANQAQYNLEIARAGVASSESDLKRATQNLNYATITSPIDGTVISRSVDVGQTVQSSFSSPELFLIAGDLGKMQILAAVDESDIGLIAEGQEARFTVQAYEDDSFTGVVRQVRLQSSSTENVVSYVVVVDVENTDGRLLPGMTATVDFLVESVSDVMHVANAALRYRPDEEVMTAALEKMRAQNQNRQKSGEGGGQDVGRTPDEGRRHGDTSNRGMLWGLDEAGELVLIPVRTGLSDGSNTQVTNPQLETGRQIVAGVSKQAPTTKTNNPFQQNKQEGGRRPPGPPPGGF